MRFLAPFLTLGLLSTLFVAPSAAAANCDGDPMYWNKDYPSYHVCKAIVEGDWSHLDAYVEETVDETLWLVFTMRDNLLRIAGEMVTCLTGGPCPQ